VLTHVRRRLSFLFLLALMLGILGIAGHGPVSIRKIGSERAFGLMPSERESEGAGGRRPASIVIEPIPSDSRL
jgi:hypothetical protein